MARGRINGAPNERKYRYPFWSERDVFRYLWFYKIQESLLKNYTRKETFPFDGKTLKEISPILYKFLEFIYPK